MLQNGGKSGIINGEKGESESQQLREELARDVLSLTDEQAAYVLRRVKCLLQSERSEKRIEN